MKQRTEEFKKEIQNLETIQERLELVKNKYEDETAYIVTCGSSLGKHDEEILKEKLKDKLVLSIKQSYDILDECVDFHLLNTYNLKTYNWLKNSIVFWAVGKYYQDGQLKKIIDNKYPMDFYVPVLQPPFITQDQQTARTNDFNDFYRLSKDTEVMWGPALMYELAFPIALHLGCKKIVTIGWDIGFPNQEDNHLHFHSQKTDVKPQNNEIQEAIDSTTHLYDWFVEKDIDMKIISDINTADKRFKRITLEDINNG